MEENNGGSWGSDPSISSRVDPTGVMPPFDEGRGVESLSPEEASQEWREMIIGEKKYDTWPRSNFLKRKDQLFERGFKEQLTNEKKTRQAESRKRLEDENDRIDKRDLKEMEGKVKNILKPYFDDDEKKAGEGIKDAIKAMDQIGLSKDDRHYLEETGQGNNPLLIMALAKIKDNPDLIGIVKKIGIGGLVKLGYLIPRRRAK